MATPVSCIDRLAGYLLGHAAIQAALVVALLCGLPLAVWLDLRNLSERGLRSEVDEFGAVIDTMRDFYASNVVAHVLDARGQTRVVHNTFEVSGAIPIPATFSLELARAIGEHAGNVGYRFVSDLPFANRAPHPLDDFERDALASLRAMPTARIYDVSGSIFDRRVRLVTAVRMEEACVACHNQHPESPRRDWRVGDVRGIQEFVIQQQIAANIFAFKYLLAYLLIAAALGVAFILLQHRQAALVRGVNRQLAQTNDFLATVSAKIAKYLSPQVYKGIFSGAKDVVIATERKKLTIFFSDIQGFTATAERMQPEDLTLLINEYLTEMSAIAQAHGATVDKFIGDAILAFFGDPETKGVAEDARACIRMAIDMQRRLAKLNATWRERGIEQPFRVRMGINTGFCNVGNFGSNDRMAYTIIGAEANLAAGLQAIAEPGGIVASYETFALVRDSVRGRALAPIRMKGIPREIVPYVIEGVVSAGGSGGRVISEHATGIDLFLDVDAIDAAAAARTRAVLQDAVAALDARQQAAAPADQSNTA